MTGVKCTEWRMINRARYHFQRLKFVEKMFSVEGPVNLLGSAGGRDAGEVVDRLEER
ncbi:MAG: hypothetical protein ACFFE1_02555 [Candidatus Thorarchaeota archaeon]